MIIFYFWMSFSNGQKRQNVFALFKGKGQKRLMEIVNYQNKNIIKQNAFSLVQCDSKKYVVLKEYTIIIYYRFF